MTRAGFVSSPNCPAGHAGSARIAGGESFAGGGDGEETRDLAALPGFDAELFALATGNPADSPESRNAVRLLAVVMFRAGAAAADCPFDPDAHPDPFDRWTKLVRRQAKGPGYRVPKSSCRGERRSRPVPDSRSGPAAAGIRPPSGDVDARSLDGWQADPLDGFKEEA